MVKLITLCDSSSNNAALHRKSIDQHKLCWFSNLFLNIRILLAYAKKRYQKYRMLLFVNPYYFLRIFKKIYIFCFYMSIKTKTNI
jgi:hypothetical protein